MAKIAREPYGATIWETCVPRVLKDGADTFTTLPAKIYTNDPQNKIVMLGISGNTVQNGMPTSDAPVIVEGCGVRTGNLFDMSFYKGISRITVSGTKATGTCDTFFNVRLSIPAELYGKELTWSAYIKRPDNPNTVRLQTIDGSVYKYGNNIAGKGRSTVSFTATSTIRLYVNYANTGTDTIELSDITLNLGSTAIPYEPYGYKIPVTLGNQTQDIYLDTTTTTRRIEKLVLTGKEDWEEITGAYDSRKYFRWVFAPINYCIIHACVSSHFTQTNITTATTTVGFDVFDSTSVNGEVLAIRPTNVPSTTLEDFKAWLAAQYAAGTPVTVWYALTKPEMTMVNEPLMKIGNYADSVSANFDNVSPGEKEISVNTTVQPSSVAATHRGWHEQQELIRSNDEWTVPNTRQLNALQSSLIFAPNDEDVEDIEEGGDEYES